MTPRLLVAALLVAVVHPVRAAEPVVRTGDDFVEIETDALVARIKTKGYVSGIAAGSLLDKKTGARDLGFGLHIMDFLLAPGWRDDGYTRDAEAPRRPAQALRRRPADLHAGEGTQARDHARQGLRRGHAAVHVHRAGQGLQGRLDVGADAGLPARVCATSSRPRRSRRVNDVDDLFYRIDMPGHIKHKAGDTFEQVYLSYLDKPIPAAAFKDDFAPDEKFLYQRKDGKIPERMIRAYQVKLDGKPGPWLAGMTLDPAAVSEAWCHQRGYVCFIQELHGRNVKAGESFGAAYVVGWFDDVKEMETVYDALKGKSKIVGGEGRVQAGVNQSPCNFRSRGERRRIHCTRSNSLSQSWMT